MKNSLQRVRISWKELKRLAASQDPFHRWSAITGATSSVEADLRELGHVYLGRDGKRLGVYGAAREVCAALAHPPRGVLQAISLRNRAVHEFASVPSSECVPAVEQLHILLTKVTGAAETSAAAMLESEPPIATPDAGAALANMVRNAVDTYFREGPEAPGFKALRSHVAEVTERLARQRKIWEVQRTVLRRILRKPP